MLNRFRAGDYVLEKNADKEHDNSSLPDQCVEKETDPQASARHALVQYSTSITFEKTE